jgi:transcriptional regulator with XRE-family HTH domain
MKEIKVKTGDRIKFAIKESKCDLGDVMKACDVTKASWEKILKNELSPTVTVVEGVAKVTSFPPLWLAFGIKEKQDLVKAIEALDEKSPDFGDVFGALKSEASKLKGKIKDICVKFDNSDSIYITLLTLLKGEFDFQSALEQGEEEEIRAEIVKEAQDEPAPPMTEEDMEKYMINTWEKGEYGI